MSPEPKKYLVDIEFAISLINNFVSDQSFEQYHFDLKTKSAVERQLGIIGETVNKYAQTSTEHLDNSKKIISLRNRLIHAYDSTEDEIVWAIIKRHLPKLMEEVKEKLSK
jgi:uncharacterized protein with HEPN domain